MATTAPGASTPSPTAGELTQIGSLNVMRAGHTATRLPDGRLLLAGGCTQQSCEGVTASTELLDPTTGTSVAGPDMLEPRVGQAAVTLHDGRILLIGGFGPSTVLRSTEIFDPATGAFAPGPELSGPRADPVTMVLDDGSVLVAGGYDGGEALASVELLDPAASAFRATGSMSTARTSHVGALLLDGRVLVAGGSLAGTTDEVLASAEVFDPATGSWSATGPMSIRRHKTASVVLDDGRVLIVGGSDERDGRGRYRSAELYDPATGTFTPIGDMTAPRYKLAAAVVRLVDGRVLIAGGAFGAEIFAPATGRFESVDGDDVEGFSFSTATLANDGSVLVAGGYDDTISLTDQVLRFIT